MLLFSHKVMPDSLQPHGMQHTRLPCPSLSPRVYSNSCLLSQWCYLMTSSSATLFSLFLQSLRASGSFPMSQLFASGGQSIEALASILPMNGEGNGNPHGSPPGSAVPGIFQARTPEWVAISPGASGPEQTFSNHIFIYFCLIDYAFDGVAPNKLQNS